MWYKIKIQGHLDPTWSDWLGGLTIVHLESGETLLTGHLGDQASLYGVLTRLRDLGLSLVAVDRVGAGGAGAGHRESDP